MTMNSVCEYMCMSECVCVYVCVHAYAVCITLQADSTY